MGYPHHMQSSMVQSPIEPKFPPSEEYLHHNGYTMSTGMSHNNTDYLHHQTNGMHHQNTNNYNYSQGIGGHFYHHHHHGYTSPEYKPPDYKPSDIHSSLNNGYSNGNGYYGGYYGTTGHQVMDMPIQCPAQESTNTVLGLQELGEFILNVLCRIYIVR